MQESTDRESSKNQGDCEQGSSPADSEATSKETLSDVAENEANTDASGAELDPGPSPDGAFDESDESKDAGPM
jgi:hypothetical protein